MKIYGEAHIKTLTPELIRKAFEKTGVIPFNPDVISPEMMAPSRETSLEAPLPLAPPSPVRTATTSLRSLLRSSSEVGQHSSLPEWQTHNDVTSLINRTINQLKHPELEYLAHTSPIKASAQRPPVVTTAISPINTRFADLLTVDPQTDREKVLIKALHDLVLREAHYKGIVIGLQSSVVLQQAYVERVHGQLEAREKKNSREKGALGGGHARLMTEDEVFNEIKSRKEAKAQQHLEKEMRKEAMEEYRVAMEEWKKGEEVRKAWNDLRRKEWEREVEAWKERPKPKGKKPLLGKLGKAEPKPTRPTNPTVDVNEVSFSLEESASRYLTFRGRTPRTTLRVTTRRDGDGDV